ncbi:lipocalin-like domain-containing protein [Flavobacterium soli]|uniref:lipocalin-like domain-containing protein n=1 Tax=Flavobacterium soli TaxID=344881 RepID=UPI000415AFC1|nr:lipocalin-like domain-containing protein [Flavobacterium soli]
MRKNKIVGSWELKSAHLHLENDILSLFGQNPSGILIFTKDMRFNVVLIDINIPKLANKNKGLEKYQDLLTATKGSLALFGTYTIDSKGDFASQHVIVSTFAKWNDLKRDRNQLKLTRQANLLVEHLELENDTFVSFKWQLIEEIDSPI